MALINESNMLLEVAVGPPEIIVEETTKNGVKTSTEVKKVKKFLFHELVKQNLDLFELIHDYQKLLMECEGINL